MKGLSVILTIGLVVLAGQRATRIKPAAVSLADPPSGVHSPVWDSTLNASVTWNHAETTPQEYLTPRA